MFEQHDLAAHHGCCLSRVNVPGAGSLDEHAEEGMVDEVGADKVAAARLADVDRVEVSCDFLVVRSNMVFQEAFRGALSL